MGGDTRFSAADKLKRITIFPGGGGRGDRKFRRVIEIPFLETALKIIRP